MYLRRSAFIKYLLAISVGGAFFSEWFVYIIQPLFWTKLKCEDQSCTKILFIADPQIQGDLAVPSPFNYIFNWDSDRYLKSTYSVVEKHFQPDVLVYLGDLMDEGSISTRAQFHNYVKRLSNIFDPHYPVVQVWIPGDNDIGGENEPIRHDKIEEFKTVFSQPSVIVFQNISFYKVNAITYAVPQPLDDGDLNFKIGISHYPVLERSVYAKQVINSIHPDIFFCAHEHKSKYVKQRRDYESKEIHLLQYGDPPLTISIDDEWLYEVYVPTCSYRMGTSKIGFGAAIIENNQHLKYTVFWSPSRFPYLFFYLFMLIVVIGYTLLCCFLRILSILTHRIKTEDMQFLLQQS
ncbi:unnamed protein product [Leptosia nina]|uniref:Calcineurin-like phosphoesterase domain-containing protein n=1 Tax=Leptosia nina TaxID=320188 RepID=A0AAV1J772_9NEOP